MHNDGGVLHVCAADQVEPDAAYPGAQDGVFVRLMKLSISPVSFYFDKRSGFNIAVYFVCLLDPPRLPETDVAELELVCVRVYYLR